jgi:hypothetical protein
MNPVPLLSTASASKRFEPHPKFCLDMLHLLDAHADKLCRFMNWVLVNFVHCCLCTSLYFSPIKNCFFALCLMLRKHCLNLQLRFMDSKDKLIENKAIFVHTKRGGRGRSKTSHCIIVS